MAANFAVTACLPTDTRVTTRGGWLPIGEFKSGTEVWTGEKWAKATRLSMGVHPRVRLHLSDGRAFDCDTNHKLLVQTGPWPVWKNVLEMRDDEPLSQDFSTDWGQAIGDPEDWFWAGRFVGDGWLSGHGSRYQCCWSIAFGYKEAEDGLRFCEWLDSKRIGGRNRARPQGYHWYYYGEKGNFNIGGGTKAGQDLWLSLGMERRRAKEKRIPFLVFTLNRERRRAFLDGYTSADGVTDNHRWQITSASRELLEDTVRLAESLGLCAWIGEGKTRTYWHGKPSTLWPCYILKNHRPLTILRSEVLSPEEMYTLSVDDDRHAFASEGLISKNSAQGIIKAAMVEIWQGLPNTPWRDVKTLLQIHDSLLFEVSDDTEYLGGFLLWVKHIMTGVAHLSVPIEVDFKVGRRWGEMRKIALQGVDKSMSSMLT